MNSIVEQANNNIQHLETKSIWLMINTKQFIFMK